MNCLRSVKVVRDYGPVRLVMISAFGMLVFFTLFYGVFFNLHQDLQLTRFRLPIFLALLVLVYPLHKLLHCLPVWLCGYKAKFSLAMATRYRPVLFCDLPGPISRNSAIACVGFPLVATTILSFAAAMAMPAFIHYISVIASINFGLSITDCIYISFLLKAPAEAYIEDLRDEFHILIRTLKP